MGVTRALNFLADVALAEGDYARAAQLLDEGLALCEQRGDQHGIAYSLRGLGDLQQSLGNPARAAELIAESLTLVHALDERPSTSRCLERLAWVAGHAGSDERSAILLGAAEALSDLIAAPLSAAEQDMHEHVATTLSARLGDEAFATSWKAGGATVLDEIIAYALEAGRTHPC